MTKIKKFPSLAIRKIEGGKDALKIAEELISRLGFDPAVCEREKSLEAARWMVALDEGKELELLVENLRKPNETTVYLGVNICTVPIRGSTEVLAAALEIADGLIGVKVSLVGHYLVLSASMSASGVSVEELEYYVKLLNAQESWFRQELIDELNWNAAPED